MNARQSIEYFKELGLLLRQEPGRRRGAWELASSSHDQDKQFDSLKECWKWWRRKIFYTALEHESVMLAVDMSCRDPDIRTAITGWASSGGCQEFCDDLMCDINYPGLTLNLKDRKWFPLLSHPVARHVWSFRYTDRYQMILSELSERDRHTLSLATTAAPMRAPTAKRL